MTNLKLFNWKKINPAWSFRQRPQQKAGGILQRSFDKGEMVKGGEAFSHKCSGITRSKIFNPNFHKEFAFFGYSYSKEQESCSAYLSKMRGTRNPQLLKISKSIWNYLLSHQITITAVYFPSILNVRADWESRNASAWKLHQDFCLKITKLLGTPTVDLFASRLCHQLSQYMGWKPGPKSIAIDAIQQDWNKMFASAFPPFSLICRLINKVLWENVEPIIQQTQTWHTLLLRMSIQRPLFLRALPRLLLNPLGGIHPLVKTRSLRLAASKITRKPWKWKEFQAIQSNLFPCPGDQVQLQVANRPGTSGLADVVNNKLIQFVSL